MQDIILRIQDLLADRGAPEWLQQPGAWLGIASGLVVLVLFIRILTKKQAQAAKEVEEVDPSVDPAEQGGVFGSLTQALAAQIPESAKEHKEFGHLLRAAGMYSRTARASIYAFRFILMVFPLFCAGLLAVFSPAEQVWKILFIGAIIAAVLSIIPRLYVWYRRTNRVTEINNGLADMLDMLSMCLSGGMSISSSLDHVARNLASYPSLSEELQIIRRQSDMGSLRTALTDWANRIDTPEVRQVSSLLTRGDSLGNAMTGSLLVQADHFRTARKQLATLRANRMPVFLTFPLLFCFAPAVLIVLMSPSFMQLGEFLNPVNVNNPLVNNENIDVTRITEQIQALDQAGMLNAPRRGESRPRSEGARPSLQSPPRSLQPAARSLQPPPVSIPRQGGE